MQKSPIYVGTLFTINPGYIVSIPQYEWAYARTGQWLTNAMGNLKKKREQLQLSRQSRRKLVYAINWLSAQAKLKDVYDVEQRRNVKFKLNFITLTIPANHGQTEIHKLASQMLNSWLTYARRYLGLANYIWKFEFTKAGIPHYHITSDTYIPWRLLRQSWNNQLKRNGCLDNYYRTHGRYDANSTDVHATKHVVNMVSYLSKYLLKAAYVSNIPAGRLWGCNYELSYANKCQFYAEPDNDVLRNSGLMNKRVEWKPITRKDRFGNERRQGDIYLCPRGKTWASELMGELKQAYTNHIHYLRTGIKDLFDNYASRL